MRISDWSSDVCSSDLGGSVTGLVGLETQRQSIFLDTDHSAISTQHINGSTESRATFGEIRVPIVASRSGETGGRVVATGAIRRESSDRFEKPIRTETIGLEVRPFKSLLLRSRSEEHTSELQSLMRSSYAVFCLKKKKKQK